MRWRGCLAVLFAASCGGGPSSVVPDAADATSTDGPIQPTDALLEDSPPPACTEAGALDLGFGSGGVATFPIGAATSIARGPSGTLLVGLEGAFPPATTSECAVIRLTRTGALDPTFGVGGVARVRLGDRYWCNPFDIAVQSDGSIVAAGMRYGDPEVPRRILIRFTRDGLLDTTFGDAGVVLESTSPSAGANRTVGIDSKDRIVVAAWGPLMENSPVGRSYLRRYEPDGVPDIAFGSNAEAPNPIPPGEGVPSDLAILEDDAIEIASTYSTTQSSDFVVARYLADGSLDPAFGAEGWVHYPRDLLSQYPGLVVDANAGTTVVSGTTVAHLDGAGGLDASFTPPAFGAKLVRVALAPNGKLVAVGTAQGRVAVGRFDATGAIDTGFGSSGLASSSVVDDVADLLVEADGTIVAVGTTVTTSSQLVVVSRFCP